MDNVGVDSEVRDFWDRTAADWNVQVGEEGDRNRIMNSDPVLWRFVGEVAGRRVLDAGCGTGYLTRQLRQRGAEAVGVDHSPKMIDIARKNGPEIDFRVDSCLQLCTVADESMDVVIANYVLMDVSDLEAAVKAFHRVLCAGGFAIVVFSHPCFPAARGVASDDGREIDYHWSFPYFERAKCVDPPWAHFTSEFIWFHRPLSDYWKAFKSAGFRVDDFEEPRLTPDRFHLATNERELSRSQSRPYSVAFRLIKPI